MLKGVLDALVACLAVSGWMALSALAGYITVATPF